MQHMKLLFAICAVILAAPATSHALSISQPKEIVPLPSTDEIITRMMSNVDTIVIAKYTGESKEVSRRFYANGQSVHLFFEVLETLKGNPETVISVPRAYGYNVDNQLITKEKVLRQFSKNTSYLLLLDHQIAKNLQHIEGEYIPSSWYNASQFIIPLEN